MRQNLLVRTLLLAVMVVSMATALSAQLRISVSFGPPPIPIYDQPVCPGDGFIWTPGYWAWDPDEGDYYWVPGTWVEAPEVGYLWTPPWWGWEGGAYLFHEGFWGPHIGFYGGINYGFGYFGVGFVGGRWDGGHFFYNRSVTNINVVNIHNVYNETVINNNVRVSFNGGPGGITARPRPEEELAARDRHMEAVRAQTEHIQDARANRELRASVNNGRPPIAATSRAGEFRENVVAAREAGGEYHPPANRGGASPGGSDFRNAVHPHDLPPLERSPAPNTGDTKLDKKYQQQQDKMYAKQNQERLKLQQRQEQEDQRLAKQNAAQERRQQTEQQHQQQTQQMQQRHVQERQQMQQRQSAPPERRR